MKLSFLVAASLVVACNPKPPPPEPLHVVTIGDASFIGDTCTVACDVLDALSCPEAYHATPGKCVQVCKVIGDDFDFGCVTACHDTTCVHACNVRCSAAFQ